MRAAFLRFLVGLVRGYRESCRYIRVFPTPQMAIDEDLFARSAAKHGHPFYKAFSRSQALVGFLEAHKWPRENLFDTILEASTAGEPWALTAAGIRDYLRSVAITASSAPSSSSSGRHISLNSHSPAIIAALQTTLPEKKDCSSEGSDKGSIDKETIEEEGTMEVTTVSTTAATVEKKAAKDNAPIDADAVETMQLPSFVVAPEGFDTQVTAPLGRTFIPLTKEIEEDSDENEDDSSSSSVGLYSVVVDAIVDDKADSVNADMTSELQHRFKTRAGRTLFAETLLGVEVEGARKRGEIQLSRASCQVLGTLLRSALDMAYKEDDIVSPQLLFHAGSTFYEAGKGDLVLLRLKGAKVWNDQRFWETLFYRKAHEECARLYPPSIFEAMTKWDEKSPEEKEKIASKEVQALWKLLSDFCKKSFI